MDLRKRGYVTKILSVALYHLDYINGVMLVEWEYISLGIY